LQTPSKDLALIMLKRNLFKTLIIVLLLVLSGCGKEADIKSNTVTFTDALDRTVTVEKAPETVATLIGSFADIWVLSGGEVSATTEEAWEDFDLELDAVNLGNAHSQSAEKLLSISPDFVIASAKTASNLEMCEILENADIPVAYFDVDDFEGYLDMLDICTDITGRKDLYNENGLKLKEKIDSLKQEFSNLNLPEKEKIVLLLRASSTSVKAKGSSGTVLGEMLSDLGLKNIADNDKNILENLSLESIVKFNPHHIFIVPMGNDEGKSLKNFQNLLEENPVWQSLDAVKSKRVYHMDKKLFNLKPNGRWAEAYEVLVEMFR